MLMLLDEKCFSFLNFNNNTIERNTFLKMLNELYMYKY